MRLILIFLLILSASISFAKVNVYVSILPQKYFVSRIAQDKVNISVMVMPGASPATYEPKPKQMAELSETKLYFSIGVPFEKTWLSKFASLNPDMAIIKTDNGINKRSVEKHVHDHDHAEEHHEEGIKDPHVWLDPILVVKQAENITTALCITDPASCDFFAKNKNDFIKETKLLNTDIEKIFKGSKDVHFMVFHPSWGYFADRYGLHQIPVELEGKEPKPSDLKEFIELVKGMKLKTIFIQPQFSKKAAQLIAAETGAKVLAVDPLSENWSKNLLEVAEIIAGKR